MSSPINEINNDYSTTNDGVVPLTKRRSLYHFTALWVTMAAGFTYLFLGFQFHDAGWSLGRSIGAGALGAVCYLAYALPAAYLGSSTGQTHALLTRSIFGKLGSGLMSVVLILVAAGWTAFAFNLLANLYDGLFGWGHIVAITVVLALIGIVNNVFGFTGITAFARYLVAPLMIIWILYLVIKGLTDVPGDVWSANAPTQQLTLLAGVGLAIGSVMWGNEPDTWRYGRPKFTWPILPYAIALVVGLILFVAGGWMMGYLSNFSAFDFGPAFRYTVEYSLFGALWLGAILATVLQVAINDGNYYEMINAGQNLAGHARGWRRWHTCLIMAALAAVLAWLFPHLENDFFTVAGWSAIALPSATTVMCVDQFILPRVAGLRRRVEHIPTWRAAGFANWPAIVSVLVAMLFGAWGLQLLPGQTSAPNLGLVPVEAWLIAGLLYLGLATLAARTSARTELLALASPPATPASTSTSAPAVQEGTPA
jgi:purine-cytosine permease-like protein